jgi:hypothetical protein
MFEAVGPISAVEKDGRQHAGGDNQLATGAYLIQQWGLRLIGQPP